MEKSLTISSFHESEYLVDKKNDHDKVEERKWSMRDMLEETNNENLGESFIPDDPYCIRIPEG